MRRAGLPFFVFSSMFGCTSALVATACNSAVDLGTNADAATETAATETAGPATDAEMPRTCQGLCAKLQDCRYVIESRVNDCIAECRQRATVDDIECVARTACDAIPKTCGTPSSDAGADAPPSQFDVAVCQHGCDLAHDFDCMTAADHAQCRALCESSANRKTYGACASGSGSNCSQHAACWNEFKK